MKTNISLSVPVTASPRVQQLLGFFDIPPTQRSETVIDVDLPLEEKPWTIGLIVGPSGSGKSTIATHMFPDALIRPWRWPTDKSIVDAFPASLGIKEIVELLSSVGFSSPPSWLRPYHALSNGEQFRVSIAYALAGGQPLTVIDEFSSVVDRTVAQICSAAVAKTVRRRQQKFIAVSCHYDIIDWLQPDWVFDTSARQFQWRGLQGRPSIALTVRRVHSSAWRLFKHHHYLSPHVSPSAMCFVGSWRDRPIVFTAVVSFPHAVRPGWRASRTVCLPDYQGASIGNTMSTYVASLFKATGKPYFSTNSSPGIIYARARSTLWRMTRTPSQTAPTGRTGIKAMTASAATNRLTAGFEYIGPSNYHDALRFGLPVVKGA